LWFPAGGLITPARVSRIAVLTFLASIANSCRRSLIFFPLARIELQRSLPESRIFNMPLRPIEWHLTDKTRVMTRRLR
jgi:hypothetical protein